MEETIINSRVTNNENSIMDSSVLLDDAQLDPECAVSFSRKLVRVQYPGIVKNVDRAIETLGGLDNIERVVSNPHHVLDLRLHVDNKYNKPCWGDKDYKPGILLKVKVKIPKNRKLGIQSQKPIYEYSVVGITAQNITFNRLCDFQYLPLIPKQIPESKASQLECIYHNIIPRGVLDLNYFNSMESKNMPLFLAPLSFARFDKPYNKIHLETAEKFQSSLRPEIAQALANAFMRKPQRVVTKSCNRKPHLSFTVNFTGGKVPERPAPYLLELVKDKGLTDVYLRIFKLFEERPIWTRAGITYMGRLKFEHSKLILPAVAFYIRKGPWRTCWVKYGFDPRTDPMARIYQPLDYRIRTSEGSKYKIVAKRRNLTKSSDFIPPMSTEKRSLGDASLRHSVKSELELSENCYILKPNTVPPARQLFYQFCDLHIPEIQTMFGRLPPVSADTKYDPKNGWLPASFMDQCRNIVNKYILEAIKQQINAASQNNSGDIADNQPTTSTSEYCSMMLSNIKRGIYTQMPVASIFTKLKSKEAQDGGEGTAEMVVEDVCDDVVYENIIVERTTQEHIEMTIPEKMNEELIDEEVVDEENTDDDNSSYVSDLEIDVEALEEVNQLVGVAKISELTEQENVSEQDEESDEEIDAISRFLNKHL